MQQPISIDLPTKQKNILTILFIYLLSNENKKKTEKKYTNRSYFSTAEHI